jgi:hypothetical protein
MDRSGGLRGRRKWEEEDPKVKEEEEESVERIRTTTYPNRVW